MVRMMSVCSLLVLGAACEVVQGSGSIASEHRSVDRFDGVEIAAAVDAIITLSTAEHGVELVCDDNLLQYIEVSVRGRELHVAVDNSIVIDPSGQCQARISAPELRSFSLSGSGSLSTSGKAREVEEIVNSGSGNLEIAELSASQLAIDLIGSGSIEVSGTTQQVDIFSSGSGNLAAEDLIAEDAEVRSSGSGHVAITATDSARVTLSGSGNVTVAGNPTERDEQVTGSGSLVFH